MPRIVEQAGGAPPTPAPPLSTARYVDPAMAVLVRDGSDEAPFVSLQEAYDSFGSPNVECAFLLCPGNVGPLAIPGGSSGHVSLMGLTTSSRWTGAAAIIPGLTVGAATNTGIGLENVLLSDDLVSAGTSAIEVTSCEVDGVVNAPGSTGIFFDNVILGDDVTGDVIHMQDCQPNAGSTITATTVLQVDGVTNYYIVTLGVAVVGTKVVIEDDGGTPGALRKIDDGSVTLLAFGTTALGPFTRLGTERTQIFLYVKTAGLLSNVEWENANEGGAGDTNMAVWAVCFRQAGDAANDFRIFMQNNDVQTHDIDWSVYGIAP